jgi:hypothetical protein
MVISVPHYCPNCHCANCEELRLKETPKPVDNLKLHQQAYERRSERLKRERSRA